MDQQAILHHLREEVFVRLKVSRHGVGVFAIRDIPQGIDPFFEHKIGLRFVQIPRNLIAYDQEIPESVKSLVHDMCSVRDGLVTFPTCGLHALTAGFYMNHSDNPNVAITGPNRTTWQTICAIAAGQELTANYATYDEACQDVLA